MVYSSVFYFQMRDAFLFKEVYLNPDLIKKMEVSVWRQGRISKDHEIVRQDNMESGIIATFKKNFISVNGFDQNRAYWGDNDTNLNLRFKLKKYKLIFSKKMFAIHLWHKRPPQKHMEKAIISRKLQGKPKNYKANKGINE